MKIPDNGKSKEEVLAALRDYRSADPDWSEGRIFGYVFHAEDDAVAAVEDAFRLYMWDNALDPSVFGSLLRLETEIVSMAAHHLRGDDEVVGNFSSGGTESVMLAVKTARDWARANKPGISRPQMILPITAHPAFHKAAHYFDVDAVTVPVDRKTLQVTPETVQDACTDDTILLVGSATCFAFGVSDPIPELGRIALDRGVLLHVDGCIGGFMLALYRKLGRPVPEYDFTVPGVTSISMDLHKYAFAAKGASVVLYKNKELRKHQIFTHSNWTGYTMINPTIQSTKSGGPMAGAWAALHYIGDDGYLDIARQLADITDQFIAGVDRIDDLHIMGKPEICLVAFGSDTIDVFELCDEMKVRGWHLGAQPGAMGVKESVHLTMLPFNAGQIDALLGDLGECVELVRGREPSPLVAQLAAMAQNLDPSKLDDATLQNVLGMVGAGGGKLPTRLAEINRIMNALPAPVVDAILTAFYNEWNRPEKE